MALLTWHNFQKGDATKVHDYSTNKKHSTSATAITIVAGSLGNAGRFNGTTSQVNFGDVADASGTGLITILSRQKFDVVNVLQALIFNDGEYAVKLLATGKIEFTVWTTGTAGGPKTLQSTTVLSAATLYNIVCRYNGVNMKIYLNGTEDATVAQTGDLATSANNLLMGSDGTNFFDGDFEISVIRNDALGDGTGGTLNGIGAWSTNPHGLQFTHYDVHSLETGDLISEGQYDAAGGKNMVVTYKEDTKIVRAIPISGKINFSQTPIHRGNIFDTTRQALTESTIVSGSPQIAFYKDVDTFALPSEFIKINKDGILENGSKYALLAGRAGGQTIIGGTGTTDDLIFQTTSGIGTTGADIVFKVGNVGGTEAMRILNSGFVGIGTNNPTDILEVAAANAHIKLNAITGTSTPFHLLQRAGVNQWAFGQGVANVDAHFSFYSYVGAAVALRIHTNTRVTVGAAIATPGSQFVVNGNCTIGGSYIENTAETNGLNVQGRIGAGTLSANAQLHARQLSITGAIPVLTLEQLDVDEDYIKIIGTSDTSVDRALVDAANFTTPGAIKGWLKINVKDNQATNPIVNGDYYVPFYAAPRA